MNNGQVIASAVNQIVTTNDPTAHAELLALREAGKVLGRTKLDDCIVYASGQPCPMCLAAMRMAGISKIFMPILMRMPSLTDYQQPALLKH